MKINFPLPRRNGGFSFHFAFPRAGRRNLMIAWLWLIGCLVLPGSYSSVRAATVGNQGTVDRGELGPVWRDDAAAFEIRRPTGCIALHRKGNQLVNFVNQSRRWGITLHRSYLAKATSRGVLVKEILAQARKDFTHVQVLVRGKRDISGQPAAELSILFTAVSNHSPLRLLRQELLIEVNPTEYYVLTFFSPAGDLPSATRMFKALTGSLRLLNQNTITRQRLAAVKAGKAWLKTTGVQALVRKFGGHMALAPATQGTATAATELKSAAEIRPELFEIRVHHQDIGFVRLHAYVGMQDGFKGVFCNINGREFLPGGVIIMTKSVRFWARRHQADKPHNVINYSTWTSAVERLQPINNPQIVAMRQERRIINPLTGKSVVEHLKIPYPDFFTHWTQQLGTQQAGFFPLYDKTGKLTGAYRYECRIRVDHKDDRIVAGENNRPLRFVLGPQMPGLLPSALQYLWPRMVNLKKKGEMAFVVFDSATNHLGLRVLRVLGRQTIQTGHRSVKAYHLADQLDPDVSQLWVDHRGRLLKVLHGDGSTWTPTTAGAMQKQWGDKLAALKQ